jgi:hypothetical protein
MYAITKVGTNHDDASDEILWVKKILRQKAGVQTILRLHYAREQCPTFGDGSEGTPLKEERKSIMTVITL